MDLRKSLPRGMQADIFRIADARIFFEAASKVVRVRDSDGISSTGHLLAYSCQSNRPLHATLNKKFDKALSCFLLEFAAKVAWIKSKMLCHRG